jgi:serine/threonine protein kinase
LGEGEPTRVWEDGREVGEWTVTGFLGRGGSAEVYCAKHRRLGTRAALKVLRREGAGPRERFDRESRFLMGNPGPSFPAFYGAGVEEGRPWVAMELLDECPAPAADREVARYLLDVGRGVAALHARGWLHRDVKQGNILRRADGHAVLADFGLLKAVGTGDAASDAAAERESPSVVDGREAGVGTPGHSAPEQFAGGGATPAADVYALGMLAEECFGGNPPRAWEKIIRRATAALPRQRYPSVEAMLRAIRRRHWARNGAWAVLVALGVALAAAAMWRGERRVVPPEMEAVPETAVAVARKTPEVPEIPEAPEMPEVPKMPEMSAVPDMPEVPEKPAVSEKPAIPEMPVEPEVPEVVATPDKVEKTPAAPVARMEGVRAERAAALARFEAEEWRKEAILELVEDLRKCASTRKRTIWGPAWYGLHEVTQRQWTALMDDNPSRFQGDDLPVDSLTLGACLEFLERLNETSIAKAEDRKFRLPVAWEWQELADDVSSGGGAGERLAEGWFAENAEGRTHPVGEKAESGRCADVLGNVRELTRSWDEKGGKEGFLCMGGSWADSAAEESIPKTVLEQPQFVQRHLERFDHADPGVGTVPSDYPHALCPAPGEIGFRLWAESRTPPENMMEGLAKEAVEHWKNEQREEESPW